MSSNLYFCLILLNNLKLLIFIIDIIKSSVFFGRAISMKYQDLPVELDTGALRQRALKYAKKRASLFFSKPIPEEDLYWQSQIHPAYAIMLCSDGYEEINDFRDYRDLNQKVESIVKTGECIGVFNNKFFDDMVNTIRQNGITAVGDENFWHGAQLIHHTLSIGAFNSDYFRIYDQCFDAYVTFAVDNDFPNDSFERLQTHLDKMKKVIDFVEQLAGEKPEHPLHSRMQRLKDVLVTYAIHDSFDPWHNPIEDNQEESNADQRVRLFKALYDAGDERVSDHYDFLIENMPEKVSHREYELLMDCANYWYKKVLVMVEQTDNESVLSMFMRTPIYNGIVYTLMNHKLVGQYYNDEQFEQVVENAWNTHVQLETLLDILGNHPLIKPMRLQIKERLGTLAHQQSMESEAQKTRVAQEEQASHAATQAYYQQQQAVAAVASANAARSAANSARRQADETARIRRRLS